MICYLRVYRVGHAGTSAKQRIDVTYLEATGNASRLVPYLAQRQHRMAACLGNAAT